MEKLDRFLQNELKLRHLRLLIALANLRSVSRAAAYLNVTQSAVSKTLALLEQGVGAPLFRRLGRGMEPTEQGECLLRHAREMLGHLSAARDQLRDLQQGRITRVAIGVLPAGLVQLIPHFLVRLHERSPEVVVTVREGTMGALLQALSAGDLDLAVGVLPDALGSEFACEVLYEDVVVAVARPGHPLLGQGAVSGARLASYPVVLPPEGTILRAPIDSFFARHGVAPAWRVESVSNALNVGLLQLSDAIGLLSAESARHLVAQGVLAVVPASISELTVRVGMACVAGRESSGAHQLLRGLLHGALGELLPGMRAFRQELLTRLQPT